MPKTVQTIPTDIIEAFKEADKYFPTELQKFQFFDKYSRFDYSKGRRETWIETVDRAVTYLKDLSEHKLSDKDYAKVRQFILEMKATPSMRLLAMAGEAARRQNIAIYNCSFLNIDSIDAMVEELIISMAGCGVGWSVESQYIDKLPEVKMQTGEILPTFQIPDSTEGWTEAFRLALKTFFDGKNIQFDYSLIREAGVPLKIKGGRASGPTPLRNLLDFTRKIILRRQGQKLRPIDVHDILCKMAEAIVSGGVRRTACISLFDDDDMEMLNCKNGDMTGNEQRYMSNNSTVWTDEISQDKLLKQMFIMIDGERGEPGIFSRFNAATEYEIPIIARGTDCKLYAKLKSETAPTPNSEARPVKIIMTAC
jgi:ribonucleoside-diphosphate reductase alpha chain